MTPIFTSLSPNTERDDVRLAWKLLFSPWKWKKGTATRELEELFEEDLGVPTAVTFSSGRAALFAILTALNIKEGDEVLLQAYTCVAVPAPAIWAGAKPIYVDVKDDLTMSPEDLKEKITPKSKAVIVQHTFGHAADMKEILSIAKKRDLFVIEDCAHVIGGTLSGLPLGTFGDAALFSFGRDKALSSVFGGIAVARDRKLGERVKEVAKSFKQPSFLWIKQQLLHPIVLSIAKRFYHIPFRFGAALLAFSTRVGLTSKAVYSVEKQGGEPRFARWRMPNALAALAQNQLGKLDRMNDHRREIAWMYAVALKEIREIRFPHTTREDVPLRFTLRVPDPVSLIRAAKKAKIELGNWYDVPVAPKGVDKAKIGYVDSSCPLAEVLAKESVNLPTHIGVIGEDAMRIITFLREYFHDNTRD